MSADSPNAAANRLKAYKNKGLDLEELRRQREEEGVQLRKQKRDEQVIIIIKTIYRAVGMMKAKDKSNLTDFI